MSWKFFVGASILAVGLLLKAGAPLAPVVLGVAAAAVFNWLRLRGASDRSKKRFPMVI